MQARAARGVDVVAVSSDSDNILAAAEAAGAVGVRRPEDISGDLASSESAWLHALDATDERLGPFERIVALQATSPIRESSDIEDALATFERDQLDSLLSVCEVEDYFNWRIGANGPEPINYDYHNRRMRQQIEKRYLENGSFYVFDPVTAARAEQSSRRQDRFSRDGSSQDVPDRSSRRRQAVRRHHA